MKATARPAASQPTGLTTRPSTPQVVAYYFHRTLRCPTCRRIEELAKQAVENGFPGELAMGTVEWRPTNIETAGNEHFEKDFNLKAQSLVLVKLESGQQTNWKNLPRVWDLVGDPAGFVMYVQEDVRAYLYGHTTSQPE